jgi:hypothetical protein
MLDGCSVGPSRGLLGLDGHPCPEYIGVDASGSSLQQGTDLGGFDADVLTEAALQALEDPLDLLSRDRIYVVRCDIVTELLEAAQQFGALVTSLPEPFGDRWSAGKILEYGAQG